MKKIIALALALIMALSMASVAFAAETLPADITEKIDAAEVSTKTVDGETVIVWDIDSALVNPGDALEVTADDWYKKGSTQAPKGSLNGWKITKVDFTTGALEGASLIDDVVITKEKDAIRLTIDEAYTMALEDAKPVAGVVYLLSPADANGDKWQHELHISFTVNNRVAPVSGAKKAADAEELDGTVDTGDYGHDVVTVMDEDGGYVTFDASNELTGVVKMNKDEKTQLSIIDTDEDTLDAMAEVLGEDYEAIVEYVTFETRAFDNEVAFSYDAYEEDPHYFYVWDGEGFNSLEAKFNDDEEVMKYEFSAAAEGTIVITDVEIVAAAEEETKNPDTGANDVVGVAAALAVVSLVAAGAVSLKK